MEEVECQANKNYNNITGATGEAGNNNIDALSQTENEETLVLNYDDKKINLALDRVPDVTRDRVNPKDTLKLLELHAVEKIFTLNRI